MESNKNKELKIKSFRVDEDTFEKFKQIAVSSFGNQNQCLDALINLYEMENSKTTLIERKLEIESFQDYLNKINQLFVTSLQLSQDAETRVREEFLKQLTIKDTTIERLQHREKDNNENLVKYKEQLKKLKEKVTTLEGINTELDKDKSTLSQLVSRNYEIIENNKNEIDKLKTYKAYKVHNEKINKELEQEKRNTIDLKQQLNERNLEIELLKKELILCAKRAEESREELLSYRTLLDASRREHKKELELIEGKYSGMIKNERERLQEFFDSKLDLERKTMELKIKTLEQEKNILEFQLNQSN